MLTGPDGYLGHESKHRVDQPGDVHTGLCIVKTALNGFLQRRRIKQLRRTSSPGAQPFEQWMRGVWVSDPQTGWIHFGQ
jgi:hypothetical protein